MKRIVDRTLRLLHWISKYDYFNRTKRWDIDFSSLMKSYGCFIEKYRGIKYQIEWVELEKKEECMFVGGQYAQNIYWGIPCHSNKILKFDVNNRKIEFIEMDCKGIYKYTGGCNIDEKIYCFPRSQDNILCIDIANGEYEYLDLKTGYNREHHYGGVCIENKFILQPPRLCNTLLKYDIMTNKVTHIKLSRFIRKFKYCGSIYHPNGCVYFFPDSRGPIIKYSLKLKKWKYIGAPIYTYVFEAKVCADGNIYGFSSSKGILKIDVYHNKTEMLYKNKEFGAYGTKLGLDGRIYSIPGRGKTIWAYDPIQDTLERVCEGLDSTITCAGGATTDRGIIIGGSCCEGKLLLMTPEKTVDIPSDIYNIFYRDFY